MCDLWTHATCGRVDGETYQNLKGDWYCQSCVGSQLPSPIPHLPFHNVSIPGSVQLNTSLNTSTLSTRSPRIAWLSLRQAQSDVNARSIMNKIPNMLVLLRTQRLNLLAVTETFLDDDILDSEMLWIELSLSPNLLLMGVFYNPPSSTMSQLSNSLAAINTSITIVICGDFNLPHINWSAASPNHLLYKGSPSV